MLLVTPLVLNDGTKTHTFEYRGPLTGLKKKNSGADYVEPSADLAENSTIVVKHDSSGSVPRHLLQMTNKRVPGGALDGLRRQKTFNFTYVGDEGFSDAEVTADFTMFLDLLAEAGLINNLRKNLS